MRSKQICWMESVINPQKKNSVREYKSLYENEVLKNFSRYEFYCKVQKLINKYEDNDAMLTELYEIELSLIGHCSELGIQSFIDEPTDQEQLVSYVRSLSWLKNT